MRLRQEELRDDCNLCYTASLSRCHDVTGTRAKLHKYETTWTEVICIIALHIGIHRVPLHSTMLSPTLTLQNMVPVTGDIGI